MDLSCRKELPHSVWNSSLNELVFEALRLIDAARQSTVARTTIHWFRCTRSEVSPQVSFSSLRRKEGRLLINRRERDRETLLVRSRAPRKYCGLWWVLQTSDHPPQRGRRLHQLVGMIPTICAISEGHRNSVGKSTCLPSARTMARQAAGTTLSPTVGCPSHSLLVRSALLLLAGSQIAAPPKATS